MTTMTNYGIDPNKLAAVRGKLMAELHRDITWQDFAKLAGVTVGTICNLRSGRSGGTPTTWKKIVTMLRSNGVAVSEEDLLRPFEQAAN